MMGMYIKGMKMPEKIEPGLVIEFAEGIDGKRYARLHHYRYGGLTDWLEAVSVPPHGRLIDADTLMRHKGDCYDADGHLLYAVGTGNILCAPTIIPAEE